MRVGDLIEFTEAGETFIGLVVKVGLASNMGKTAIKIQWCFHGEDKDFFDETSWLCTDEVCLISKRT